MDIQRDYTYRPAIQSINDGQYYTDTRYEGSKLMFTEPHVTPFASGHQPTVPGHTEPSSNRNRLSPLKQSLLPWLLAAISISLYGLTVCYALGTTGLRYLSFTSTSPSRSLTLIRTLSELTSICTVILINTCAGRVMWMLVAAENGTRLSTFLAVHYGSDMWSWLQLIFQNANGGRFLSWCRIVLSISVPAMGIVILSAININAFFDSQTTFPVAAGIGNFNVSFADEYQGVIATYMATEVSSLLQSTQVAWPVTTINSEKLDCTTSTSFSGSDCGTGYFLHGGTQLITPWPTNNTAIPYASIYTVHNMRGIQLDFTKPQSVSQFRPENDCITLGNEQAAFQVCVSQHSANAVNTKYVSCPESGSCLGNKAWQASVGWTTRMTLYSRHATAHFSRANLSAVSVADFSPPTAYSISAADMLYVFKLGLNATNPLGHSLDSARNFVAYLSITLYSAESSAATSSRAQLNLYNFMAMPIFHFQPMYNSPYTETPSPDGVLAGLPQDQGLYTTASLSTYYYGLTVALWTIVVYSTVMGIILLFCIAILVLSSLPKTAGGIPDTTAWPFIDVTAECRLFDDSRTTNHESHVGHGMVGGNTYEHAWRVKNAKGAGEQVRAMADIKIKLM